MCDITTGGIDETATMITAFLIPYDYNPPLLSGAILLPKELGEIAVSRTDVMRNKIVSETRNPDKLKGICYSPFRDNENPNMGIFPTLDEMKYDMELIPKITHAIRTYGITNTLGNIPQLCEEAGIECYPGAWLGKVRKENMKEVESIINIARENLKSVKALIIGNEVLLRGDLTEDDLINYIRSVKDSTKLPVTTAEICEWWIEHPKLANEVDFLTVHIHPFWYGISIEDAAEYVIQTAKQIKQLFPAKRIVIGETGWPSGGEKTGNAIPSKVNQARFIKEFTSLAAKEDIEYFYFSLFDEKWKNKDEGEVGTNWGIFYSNGSLKENNRSIIPIDASGGITRAAREISN